MKRYTVFVLVVSVLLVWFCGCGGDNPAGISFKNVKTDFSDAYEVRQITFTGGQKEKPFFVSWDESEIFFAQVTESGNYSYKVLNLNNMSETDVLFGDIISGRYDRWRPNCSSDGNLLVYVSGYYHGQLVFTNGLNQDLYSIDTYEGFFQSVALSRDGKKLAYIIDKSNGLSREMVVGSTEGNGGDGTGRIPFNDIGMSYMDNLCFSPDASEIVFEAIKDENKDLYLTSLSGDLKRLTLNSADDSFPCFSPNGGKIIFISKRNGGDDVYIMDLSKPTGK